MNDSLTASVARLYRAGSENSRQQQKLRIAADKVLHWIIENVPRELMSDLPMDCRLDLVANEFSYKKPIDPNGNFTIKVGTPIDRESLLRFSSLISLGFLDELSKKIEKNTETFARYVRFMETDLDPKESPEPLIIFKDSYADSLRHLAEAEIISADLAEVLAKVINEAETNFFKPVEATPALIQEAKKVCSGGIDLTDNDTGEKTMYELVVVKFRTENDGSFALIPRFKNGTIKHLSEFV